MSNIIIWMIVIGNMLVLWHLNRIYKWQTAWEKIQFDRKSQYYRDYKELQAEIHRLESLIHRMQKEDHGT